jgi:uncharacterized protein (DUF4415 family)
MSEATTKYHTSDGGSLTPSEIARLDAVEGRLGDCGDIPEIWEPAWKTAVRGKHAKQAQQAISIRLDVEVLRWVRAKGSSSSVEINRILREKMEAESHA